MVSSQKRDHYLRIRLSYYHAGRLLHVRSSNFHSAGIMLGYAVETFMKAGLIEVLTEKEQNKKGTPIHSHDVREILAECRKHGLFTDIKVSDDFLEQVHYQSQRYPSQILKVLDEADKKNTAVSNVRGWIHYYDDLIVQLDCALCKMTSDPSVSIIYLTMLSLETLDSRDILRENAHALLQFNDFAAVIRRLTLGSPDHKRLLEENLSKGINFYFNPDARQEVPFEQIVSIANNYRASKFELPKWESTSAGVKLTIHG